MPADLEYGEEDESEDRAADDKARCMAGTLKRSGLRNRMNGKDEIREDRWQHRVKK